MNLWKVYQFWKLWSQNYQHSQAQHSRWIRVLLLVINVAFRWIAIVCLIGSKSDALYWFAETVFKYAYQFGTFILSSTSLKMYITSFKTISYFIVLCFVTSYLLPLVLQKILFFAVWHSHLYKQFFQLLQLFYKSDMFLDWYFHIRFIINVNQKKLFICLNWRSATRLT